MQSLDCLLFLHADQKYAKKVFSRNCWWGLKYKTWLFAIVWKGKGEIDKSLVVMCLLLGRLNFVLGRLLIDLDFLRRCPSLYQKMFFQESLGNIYAVSSATPPACGLCQLMPETAQWYGLTVDVDEVERVMTLWKQRFCGSSAYEKTEECTSSSCDCEEVEGWEGWIENLLSMRGLCGMDYVTEDERDALAEKDERFDPLKGVCLSMLLIWKIVLVRFEKR